MSAKSFVGAWLAIFVGLVAAAAAFNMTVDPYLVFGAPRIHGFNQRKPSVMGHEFLMKAYEVGRAKPRSVILGSSRADMGLDASHPAWPTASQPVYNLALAGGGTYTALRYLQHALTETPLHLVVLGLDFEYFLSVDDGSYGEPGGKKPVLRPAAEYESRLALDRNGEPNSGLFRRRVQDFALATISLDALGDSISTIIANRDADSANLLASGDFSEAEFRMEAAQSGEYPLFAQKNDESMRGYATPRRALYVGPGRVIPAMNDLQDIIELCRKNGIELVLFIQPAHVDRLEIYDLLGYWDYFEQWKHELVALANRYSQAGAGFDIPIWDFSGYDIFSEELVPRQGDTKTQLQWYWEPGHYHKALGDLMLARMFGGASQSGFGVRLTPESLDAHLASIRAERLRYRKAHPEERQRMLKLYEAIYPAVPVVSSR